MSDQDPERTGGTIVDRFAKAAGDGTLQQLMDEAVATVGAAEGSLLLLDPPGRMLRFVIVCSPSAERLLHQEVPLDKSITGLSVSLQQPMIVNDVQRSETFNSATDVQTGTTTDSLLAVPLSTPEREFGAITAINSKSQGGFAAADLDAYEEYARRICERLGALDLDMDDAGASG